MSKLLAELAGEEFAAQYTMVTVTGCRVKKETMSMYIDIDSEEFPCTLPLDALKEKIFEKFGISKVHFAFQYRNFSLTDENFAAFYETVLKTLCEENKTLSNILLGSTGERKGDVLEISLRFGGERTLLEKSVDTLAEQLISKAFGISLKVLFVSANKAESEIMKLLEEEKNRVIAGSA